jgi:replicative DNA helicase
MTGSTDETSVIACSVSKHRSGKRGRCQLEFSKQYQQWSSRDKRFVEEKP